MLKHVFPDMDERMKGEFDYLVKKYPKIAFNVETWTGTPNDRAHGKKYLYATEGYITVPRNYDPAIIKQYDGYLIPNRKFKELHPELNIILTNGPLKTDDYWFLDNFTPYEDKIRAVCALNKIYHTGREGDILHMRDKVMKELTVEPHLELHTYGPTPYGKPGCYKGHRKFKHSHLENLKIINKYLFCFCPEPMYHELWSWDWLTERLLNCFKSKTVAIYYGCYNIDEIVPNDLYVDYRKFAGNHMALSKHLIALSRDKKRYNDMVERAYEWNQSCRIGNMEDLEVILSSLK